MSTALGRISDEHKRKVGEGVVRAWKKRYGDGFKPKSPSGQLSRIKRLLNTDDPVWSVEFLEQDHREICSRLQDIIQKHGFGIPGHRVDLVVIEELERVYAQLSRIRTLLSDELGKMIAGWLEEYYRTPAVNRLYVSGAHYVADKLRDYLLSGTEPTR